MSSAGLSEEVTAEHIHRLLETRHSPPEWAPFFEVELRGRRVDFLAVGLWGGTRSVGHRAIGAEIKVSRSDFFREIEDPSKRAPMEALLHECWFATPCGLVKPDEVPEGWGLLEIRGEQLVRRKAPTQRTPAPTWELVSQIARKTRFPNGNLHAADHPPPVAAWRYAGKDLTEAEVLAIAAELWPKQLDQARAQGARDASNATRLERDRLQAFFSAMGVYQWDPGEWTPARIMDEVRKLRQGTDPTKALHPKLRALVSRLDAAQSDLMSLSQEILKASQEAQQPTDTEPKPSA